ncbi:ATP-binding SpoIIE family protein phosphatase [Kitasatospora paracochleata]|uniref:PAS domain S-box-containing protein n=1 Tax=Kitasatospora paracochleata TaxID=58354 RepID=A0ABT1J199_9ACTN|nr:SpoIIE family protein phosphatase [Kitasatospora paracochleata]MCP2311199.1 PAS domain S-box-containing protein [Kitasatospora paracochleata]
MTVVDGPACPNCGLLTGSRSPGAARERFEGLLETAPDAMVIVDDTGTIRLVNAQTEALFGYDREELLGRPVEVLVPGRYHADHARHRSDYTANRQVRPMGAGLDLHGLRKDGTEFPVEISLSPLETADGLLISAAVRDVTERKAAEAELTALYEQQRHAALTLQRSLMGTPPDVPGLTTASRYLPATQGLGVGGDWFDLIPLGAGRVGVLMGDVMGRGLEAAAIMGQIRSAAHALAKTGMEPNELVRALDAVVADLAGPDQLVTCCYLVIAPDAGEVTVCSAGHLPALIAGPDGGVRVLPAPVSVPLGVGDVLHQQQTTAVEPGALLLLYTDGLIETPGSDIEDRLDHLVAALDRAYAGADYAARTATPASAPDLEAIADDLLASLLPDSDGHDDVTLLLTRLPAAPLATTTADFPATAASVAEGRSFLAKTLLSWGFLNLVDDARLLVSEVMTNAVRHGQGRVRIQARYTARELTVEVADDSPRLPRPRLASDDEESGRGLALVESLADTWGVRPSGTGKATWFSFDLTHDHRPADALG